MADGHAAPHISWLHGAARLALALHDVGQTGRGSVGSTTVMHACPAGAQTTYSERGLKKGAGASKSVMDENRALTCVAAARPQLPKTSPLPRYCCCTRPTIHAADELRPLTPHTK